MNLEDLKNIDLDSLTIDKRVEVQKIIAELEKRKLEYPILDLSLQEHQEEFREKVALRNPDGTPRWKFIIFLWGNGSGKTFTWAYILISIALWKELCWKFNIPYSWEASLIKVYTTTWDNIRDNIDRKYLLWTWTKKDVLKFPWYINKDNKWPIVKKVRWDKDILREISLINWAVITFGTYDQGQARLQGWEPQYIWMDELPTRYEDLVEIFRGSRSTQGQVFISATPTNYNKKIHDYLFNWDLKDVLFVKQVDSFENKHAKHDWMKGLTKEDIKIRRFGSFTPPEWLVYPNFSRDDNMVEHFKPKLLGKGVRYFGAVDFGWTHPLAFLFIAVDSDWNVYVFDMIYKKQLLMKDLASQIREKCAEHSIELEKIIGDSAGASQIWELKAEWIKVKWIHKKQKVMKTNFAEWGRLKVNQLFELWKIYISDRCMSLIDELEVHHYKENWDVEKSDDDACDALRYFITDFNAPSEKRNLKKEARRIKRESKSQKKY